MENTADLITELAYHRRRAAELELALGMGPTRGSVPTTVEVDPGVWQVVADHAQDFISVHSAAGDYVYASPSSERLFGWTPNKLVGRSAYEFIHPKDLERIAHQHAAHAHATPDRNIVEYRLLRPDGTWVWVETVSRAFKSDRGIEQIICVTRDIQERKSVEAELQRTLENLNAFASAAAHDLHEPLRTLRVFSDWLGTSYADRLDDEGRDYLHRIQNGATRMANLIDSLLAYARAGNTELVRVQVALRDCARTAIEALQISIREAEAEVTVDPLPEVPGDGTLLAQVFQNLVGNSLRHRRPDVTPQVRITSRRVPGGWEIRVRDNGRGFPPEQASLIFEPFKRLTSRRQGAGTGLGLAICSRIIERHGGSIRAEGQPGAGATFSFILPT